MTLTKHLAVQPYSNCKATHAGRAPKVRRALPVQVAGKAHTYSEERVLRFADDVCAAVAEQLAHAAAGSRSGSAGPAHGSAGPAHVEEGATAPEELQPCVYFLPGARP